MPYYIIWLHMHSILIPLDSWKNGIAENNIHLKMRGFAILAFKWVYSEPRIMRRSIFPCFLGSIFCKLLFHMFPESIKNETRKLFHYYLYTEPDLLRTGVKWLIGVSNIMQTEDHVRENKHVIYNCTSYMYMCMINNCIF